MTNLDPTTLAVVRGRLEQTTDEMDTVFERMAFSPVISDAWDRADGIYRPDNGSMIVQGERGLPIFVGTMQYATRAVIDHAEKPRPGDIFLINDPYLGGTHVMDVTLKLGGRGAALAGRVLDSHGAPIAGALLEVGDYGWEPKEPGSRLLQEGPPARRIRVRD